MPEKPRVGLPTDFSLNVERPVELGDYLDEMDFSPPPRPRVREAPEPRQATAASALEMPVSRSGPSYGKRKQLNLRNEEWRRLGELVEHIRDYGVQADTAASEVLGALITLAYEARSLLNLSRVPSRGRWGSQNAKVFRDALSLALAESIVAARVNPPLENVAALGEG